MPEKFAHNPVVLPEKIRLVECNADAATDAWRLTCAIMAELAAQGKSGLFNLSIPEEDFRDYFTAGDCTILALETAERRRVAYGIGHFREYKTRLFLNALREFAQADVALEDVGYIYLIEVDPEFRGHGFQRFLFFELEERLIARGAQYLTGTVSPKNRPSLNNFLLSGYVKKGQIALPSGYPRLLMVKKAR